MISMFIGKFYPLEKLHIAFNLFMRNTCEAIQRIPENEPLI